MGAIGSISRVVNATESDQSPARKPRRRREQQLAVEPAECLLEAAAAEFAACGYEGVSTRSIPLYCPAPRPQPGGEAPILSAIKSSTWNIKYIFDMQIEQDYG